MRYFGNLHTPLAPVVPDTRLSLLLTAGTAQAFDWPTGCDLFRVNVASTISGVNGPVMLAPASTGVSLPATGGVVTTLDSSGGIPISMGEPQVYQRPRGSTGFSLLAGSSFSVCIEFWSRAATT